MNHLANRIEDCTMPKPTRCAYCGTTENVRPDGPEGEPICVECLFKMNCKIADEIFDRFDECEKACKLADECGIS